VKVKCPKKMNGECNATGAGCAHANAHKPTGWCNSGNLQCPQCVPVHKKKNNES